MRVYSSLFYIIFTVFYLFSSHVNSGPLYNYVFDTSDAYLSPTFANQNARVFLTTARRHSDNMYLAYATTKDLQEHLKLNQEIIDNPQNPLNARHQNFVRTTRASNQLIAELLREGRLPENQVRLAQNFIEILHMAKRLLDQHGVYFSEQGSLNQNLAKKLEIAAIECDLAQIYTTYEGFFQRDDYLDGVMLAYFKNIRGQLTHFKDRVMYSSAHFSSRELFDKLRVFRRVLADDLPLIPRYFDAYCADSSTALCDLSLFSLGLYRFGDNYQGNIKDIFTQLETLLNRLVTDITYKRHRNPQVITLNFDIPMEIENKVNP